jgi:hypothetical protein
MTVSQVLPYITLPNVCPSLASPYDAVVGIYTHNNLPDRVIIGGESGRTKLHVPE